jgi:hypothetical protein
MIYTENKLITLSSKYGIQQNGTFKSNILFNFKNLLSDEEHILKSYITVLNAQIPVSFYVITSLNNKLVLQTSVTTTITISNGNYSANTLITELQTKFLSAGITFTSIQFNKINGILSFISNGFTNYYFTSASTLLNVLGTTSSIISVSTAYKCPYPLNLLGVQKLSIKSERLAIHSVSSIDFSFSNTLVTIPCDVPPYSLISYISQSDQNKNLLNIRNINEIDIQIFDENNNFIDFNNLDWTITLTISSELSTNEQKYYLNDILQNNNLGLKNINEPLPPEEPQVEEIPETQEQKELKILNYKNNI